MPSRSIAATLRSMPPSRSFRLVRLWWLTATWLVVASVATSIAGPAWADGQRDLEDGIAFYDALDTARARVRLQKAARAWDLGPEGRATAFLYLGMLAFELGQTVRAERAWHLALTLDADIRPPERASPKIVSAFQKARRSLPDPPPPVPRQDPAPEDPAAEATAPPADKPQTQNGSPPAAAAPPLPVAPVAPPPPAEPDLDLEAATPDDDDEGISPWLWVGLGGAALAAAAAVLVVVLVVDDDAGSECAEGGGGCLNIRLQ